MCCGRVEEGTIDEEEEEHRVHGRTGEPPDPSGAHPISEEATLARHSRCFGGHLHRRRFLGVDRRHRECGRPYAEPPNQSQRQSDEGDHPGGCNLGTVQQDRLLASGMPTNREEPQAVACRFATGGASLLLAYNLSVDLLEHFHLPVIDPLHDAVDNGTASDITDGARASEVADLRGANLTTESMPAVNAGDASNSTLVDQRNSSKNAAKSFLLDFENDSNQTGQ
ncbi:hypothetical protein MRX96_011422 [Rhipicephalus microplus]